ncbi:fungal-specific transcription factor domain-containing protein [Xylaria sp. FL1042]|nr:fungal-specific transcription factor domain-containing protein [Xylaria sp. FL1042]
MPRTTRGTPSKQDVGNPPLADEKRFACTHSGCNKRFTRAEHVQRHALNHTAGQYTCLDCRAHFKRPDLLKRHMNRHRQKEQEADGPGNGILNTRKRSWKTLTGEVVETRPYPLGNSSRNNQHENTSEAQEESPPRSSLTASNIIPPTLISMQSDLDGNAARNLSSDFDISYPTEDNVISYDVNLCEFTESSFCDFEHFEYDQTFQPDTASSFNMPYTTSLDYNWLFGDSGRTSTQQSSEVASGVTTQSPCLSGPENHLNQNTSDQQIRYDITPESMESLGSWVSSASEDLGGIDRAPAITSNAVVQCVLNPITPHHAAASATTFGKPKRENRRKQNELNIAKVATQIRIILPEIECPLSMRRKPPQFPSINSEIRLKLLDIIKIANPSIPDQQYSIREHPLLSSHHLDSYLELYFTHFNTAYPLIHLPSFDTCAVEPLLIMSMLLLGATYSSEDSHQLAVCIHDVIRPSIFAHAGFSPRPKLWILQAILLVECFGKSRAGQQQHDMSHLFHGLLINLIRRSDCQSVQTQGPSGNDYEANDSASTEKIKQVWEKWSEAEEKKRLALLCFMWDTQHAVLFCQSLCMSSFELRITLPCSQDIWEAPDATSWAAAWRASSSRDDKTSFLAALKSYLNQGLPRPATLSVLSRVLLLHGLMSIAWDMQRREQTSLGVVLDHGTCDNWRTSLSAAYDTWKLDFDSHCQAAATRNQTRNESSLGDDGDADLTSFATAYGAVYHAAKALLNMDFLDIQIYAGSRHILGRPVQQRDYIRSSQVVKLWAATMCEEPSQPKSPSHTKRASTASWHAARILYEIPERLADPRIMELFHVPWCLYLATLTCWVVHHARPGRSLGDDSELESDEIIWDPKGDMRTFISNIVQHSSQEVTIQTSWQRGTTALAWVMADVLTKVRWGIIQSGVTVLQGLIPQRLIHQYEEHA